MIRVDGRSAGTVPARETPDPGGDEARHERILTTHTGSPPRPEDLVSLLYAEQKGELVERAALDARVHEAVREIVRQQVEVGIDVVSDGEMGKVGYSTYVTARLTGFAGPSRLRPPRCVCSPSISRA